MSKFLLLFFNSETFTQALKIYPASTRYLVHELTFLPSLSREISSSHMQKIHYLKSITKHIAKPKFGDEHIMAHERMSQPYPARTPRHLCHYDLYILSMHIFIHFQNTYNN